MSKQTLLEHAEKTLSKPHDYEEIRKNIGNTKYWFGVIDDKDVFLDNLVVFGAPSRWKTHDERPTKTGEIYQKIAPTGESGTLRSVTERIQAHFAGKTTKELLIALRQDTDEWFSDLLHLYVRFDVRIFSPCG